MNSDEVRGANLGSYTPSLTKALSANLVPRESVAVCTSACGKYSHEKREGVHDECDGGSGESDIIWGFIIHPILSLAPSSVHLSCCTPSDFVSPTYPPEYLVDSPRQLFKPVGRLPLLPEFSLRLLCIPA